MLKPSLRLGLLMGLEMITSEILPSLRYLAAFPSREMLQQTPQSIN